MLASTDNMLTLVTPHVLGSRLFSLVWVSPGLWFLDLCSNMQLSSVFQACTGTGVCARVCVRVRELHLFSLSTSIKERKNTV